MILSRRVGPSREGEAKERGRRDGRLPEEFVHFDSFTYKLSILSRLIASNVMPIVVLILTAITHVAHGTSNELCTRPRLVQMPPVQDVREGRCTIHYR